MSGNTTVTSIIGTTYNVEVNDKMITLTHGEETISVGPLAKNPTYRSQPHTVTVYVITDSNQDVYTVANAHIWYAIDTGHTRAFFETTVFIHAREYRFVDVAGFQPGYVLENVPFDESFTNGGITIPPGRPTAYTKMAALIRALPVTAVISDAAWDFLLDLVPGRTADELTIELLRQYMEEEKPFRISRSGLYTTNGVHQVYRRPDPFTATQTQLPNRFHVPLHQTEFVADYLVGKRWSEVGTEGLPQFMAGPKPFRYNWTVTYLTNGDLDIPVTRPAPGYWGTYDARVNVLRGVHERDWRLMLDILEGKFLRDINLPDMDKEVARVRREEATVQQIREKLDQVAGHLYDGPFVLQVSLGHDFIFTVDTTTGKQLFVVDSPRYGRALYVFLTHEDALAWVQRTIDVAEARKRAAILIVHTETWNERLQEKMRVLINALDDQAH